MVVGLTDGYVHAFDLARRGTSINGFPLAVDDLVHSSQHPRRLVGSSPEHHAIDMHQVL